MKPISAIFSTTVFVMLLAAGAVVAEPPLPEVSFYKDETLISSRPMTKREHTAYLKMRHAMKSMVKDSDYSELTENSLTLASESISTAVSALKHAYHEHDSVRMKVDVDVDVEAEGDALKVKHADHHSVNFEELAEKIEEEATQIAQFAERMAESVEAFQTEVEGNSEELDYTHIKVGHGEDTLTLDKQQT